MPRCEAPEEELTRLLVGTEAVRTGGAGRIAQLADSVSFIRLAAHLERQRVGSLVCSRLGSANVWVPTWFRQAMETAGEANRRMALMLEATTLDAIARLEQNGVDAVPLKGPHLARTLYGDVGARPATDVDLLVRPAQLDRARDVLVRAGYRPSADSVHGGRPLLHHRVYPGSSSGPAVELHWRLHWYEAAFTTELLDRSESSPLGYRQLDPVLGLAALLLFWVRDGLIGLRYPADIAAWWDRFGTGIERAGLRTVAGAHPALARALRVSSRAAGSLVGLPAGCLWGEDVALERREGLAIRLANWTIRGDPDQVAANRVLIDWLVAPPGGGRAFLGRQVFPPKPLRLIRLTLPVKLLVRSVVALWSIRRGRTWAPQPPA